MKSSHLNVTKNVANAIGSQMSMQSSAFGRLGTYSDLFETKLEVTDHESGVTCQSWLSGELFLQCYADESPVEDVVHATCKSAFLVGVRETTD